MGVYNETRITLAQAAQALDLNVSTVWRWAVKGCKGIKLETILISHVRYTSREALERFAERCTLAADGKPVPQVRTARQRRRAVRAAERKLATA
jgi:hypothetical protein